MTGPRGGPRPLARSVAKLTTPAIRRRGIAEAGVIVDWPKIVGERLAAASYPEQLSKPRQGGEAVLRLRVAGSWAVELQHLEPVIVERINAYFGYRAVDRLRIVQGPLPPEAGPREPRRRPLASAEADAVAATVAGIEDDELRTALARLGRAIAAGEETDE